MNLLLDTHTLLWWHDTDTQLSQVAFKLIDDPANTVFFSAVNIWEAQIKQQLGKLVLSTSLKELVNEQHHVNGFGLLPVEVEHIYQLDRLPFHHKDPFDRLLIAQAWHEGLTLVSRDRDISKYTVPTLW